MKELIWTLEALADLDHIEEFNLTRSDEWARRVEGRIVARCTTLAALPMQGREIASGLRELSIPDVQYVIVYEPGPAQVVIHRVWSTRQNREEP